MGHMVTKFIPNLITLFQDGIIDSSAVNRGGNFIVGMQVISYTRYKMTTLYWSHNSGFCSVFSGEAMAMGSLIATMDMDLDAVKRIEMALSSARLAKTQSGGGHHRHHRGAVPDAFAPGALYYLRLENNVFACPGHSARHARGHARWRVTTARYILWKASRPNTKTMGTAVYHRRKHHHKFDIQILSNIYFNHLPFVSCSRKNSNLATQMAVCFELTVGRICGGWLTCGES